MIPGATKAIVFTQSLAILALAAYEISRAGRTQRLLAALARPDKLRYPLSVRCMLLARCPSPDWLRNSARDRLSAATLHDTRETCC